MTIYYHELCIIVRWSDTKIMSDESLISNTIKGISPVIFKLWTDMRVFSRHMPENKKINTFLVLVSWSPFRLQAEYMG